MSAHIDVALLVGAAVLLVAIGAVRFTARLGVPSLLFYLALGMALGEAGVGVRFDNAELTRILGFCALIVIIAEGGLTARWSALRPVLGAATLLATLGVAVSVAVVGTIAHLLLGLDWRLALLYGAVLSSTDAAAIFSTLRRLRLHPRLVALLEAESGINDAPVVLLVLLLSTPHVTEQPWWQQALVLAYELVAGATVGLAVGVPGRWGLRRAALPASGLYPIAVFGLTVLAYGVAAVVGASGFLAVYVCGVLLGNARLPHRPAILGFADGLAWIAQIGLFVLLGLLVSPSRLGDAVVPALVVGAALLLVARPLAVAVCATPLRMRVRHQVFLSWAGLRGAVPIVLATIPLSARLPGATGLFDTVFVLVVVFTLVQVGTLPRFAKRLRVEAPSQATELLVESAPLEQMQADLLQVYVPPGSRLAGVHIDELRLPGGSAVTLVLRDGAGFVPAPDTRLRTGDSLLVVATAPVRDAAERRLRAVSQRGRLARWLEERTDRVN